MSFHYFRLFLCLILLTLTGCAKRGTINGGAKDTIAPRLQQSLPKNFTTNFKGREFRLTFDEYVKLKDVNKQLIVSPPMTTAPEIYPMVASKVITVRIKDTLQPNTTYSFNFGQSIQDNNEGNPLSQFKYIFSTGTYIDSLSIEGSIKDARELQTDNFVNVMLYEINDTYADSAFYKQKPRYITNTLDSLTTFRIDNIKAGTYQLVALKEKTSNYRLDPKSDKLAFWSQPITIPTDQRFPLELFQEVPAFKAVKPTQAAGGRLLMGFEGDPRKITAGIQNGTEYTPAIVSRLAEKDSVQIWFKPIQADSLSVSVKHENIEKAFYVKMRNQKVDSLSFAPLQSGTLHLRDNFGIKSGTPLTAFDKSRMSIVNKDSVAVPFETAYDGFEQNLLFIFKKEPLEKYSIQLLPGALKDLYEKENDTLSYKLTTRNTSDYGNLRLTLKNARSFPIIVELTDGKGKILASEMATSPRVEFENLEPNAFRLRFTYDENSNGEWDTGNYLLKKQPEDVIYYPDVIDVRANWDDEREIDLGG